MANNKPLTAFLVDAVTRERLTFQDRKSVV
jgi:hypothetical protein